MYEYQKNSIQETREVWISSFVIGRERWDSLWGCLGTMGGTFWNFTFDKPAALWMKWGNKELWNFGGEGKKIEADFGLTPSTQCGG